MRTKLTNPYAGKDSSTGKWYKGSLHAHSDRAEMYPGSTYHDEDTPRDREKVLEDYAKAGYEFVMLAEQNRYTTSQDLTGINTHGVIVIPGAELDGRRVETDQHLSHVNPSDDPAHHVELDPEKPRQTLKEIFSIAEKDRKNPLVVQVHPQFPREGDGREKDILGSYGVHALEIVNSWWMQRPHAFEDSGASTVRSRSISGTAYSRKASRKRASRCGGWPAVAACSLATWANPGSGCGCTRTKSRTRTPWWARSGRAGSTSPAYPPKPTRTPQQAGPPRRRPPA
ncbi:hypothetical protein ACFY71_04630 [Streptomyces cinerochromogenes]|uniref:hypothetical protein n=1 Tax=Streptomyces cinerochromogenes TaxID=66422 RepID=UPI0036820F6F